MKPKKFSLAGIGLLMFFGCRLIGELLKKVDFAGIGILIDLMRLASLSGLAVIIVGLFKMKGKKNRLCQKS